MAPPPQPEDRTERGEVLTGHRIEQQLPNLVSVLGKHASDQIPAGVGDRHDDAAFVVRRRRAGDQAALVQQPGLVGEPAAAVDDAVGQVGHAVAAGRRVAKTGQELELHVAEVAGFPELLLNGVPEQADDLDESEVGAELGGVERRSSSGGGRPRSGKGSSLAADDEQDVSRPGAVRSAEVGREVECNALLDISAAGQQ